LEKYYVIVTKPKKNVIPSLGYIVTPWTELFWSKLLKRYFSCPEGLTKHAIPPFRVSQKYIGLHNISFDTWRGIV